MNASDVAADADPGPITWGDRFLLGYAPLDEVHEEFVETVRAIQLASDEDLLRCLDAFATHAKNHFDEEDRWMQESDFPPRDCHMQEHAAVLESLAQVRERVEQGDLETARHFAAALARWFPGHADYLDSALSHWMCKLRWGAKPVVVRRGLELGRSPLQNVAR